METAEEILSPLRGKDNFIHCIDYEDALEAMREFAKAHVRAALETAASNAFLDEKETYSPDYERGSLYRKYFEINQESILNAYSEDNIE